MSEKTPRFNKARLKPKDHTPTLEGEILVDSVDSKVKVYLDSAERAVVTEDQTQTLTNKTTTDQVIDGDVTGTAIDTDTTLAADSDTKIASQKAVKAYVDSATASKDEASEISYDNATSGLTATDVQDAIDEVEGRVDTAETNISTNSGLITTNTTAISNHITDTTDAHDASAISNVPSGNLAATDVQTALDELQTDIDTRALDADLTAHINDSSDAHDASAISYDNSTSGLTATDSQAAIDEVEGRVDTVEGLASTTATGLSTHISDTTAHGATGAVMGTTNTQTVQNKTFDTTNVFSGDVETPSKLMSKQDTYANLVTYAETADNGEYVFATDTKQTFQVIDGALTELGGGSPGSLDTVYTDIFEQDGTSNYTSGNNATFDNGGTLDGTLADETVSPISDTTSFKYTMGSTSTNDFIKSPDITLSAKEKGQTLGLTFYYTYDGDDDDIKVVAYDDTNSEVLTSSVDFLKASSTPKRFSVEFPTNTDTATLNWGIQVVTGNSGAILVIDDVEISTNPFVYKDKIDTQKSTFADLASNMTSSASGSTLRFGTLTTTGNGIYEYDDSTGRINILRKCVISVGTGLRCAADTTNSIFLNGSRVIREGKDSNEWGSLSFKQEVEANDYITIESGNNLAGSQTQYLNIIATASTEHVIAYNSRNAANSMVRLHTGNGHGSTNTTIRRFSTEVTNTGNAITYADSATDGASFTINEDGVYFISYQDSDTSNQRNIGLSLNSSELTTSISSIATSDRLNFVQTGGANAGEISSWSGILTKGDIVRPHTTGTINGTTLVSFTISKIGVGDLLGVPLPLTCYIKDVKSSGTNGGASTANTVHTRDLNTLEGDTSFISLDSGTARFTLQPGKYEIEVDSPVFKTNQAQAFLYNVTDSSYDIDGMGVLAAVADGDVTLCNIKGFIEIQTSKVYEIRQWTSATRARNGLGVAADVDASNPQSGELYTTVKITKVR